MKYINKLAAITIGLFLVGCAHTDKAKTPPITAQTGQDLDNLGSKLSQADDKAVILAEWLKAQK
jgi:hypothetical protein